MSDATPAIAVRDLRKVYDGKAAVDGLNLTVPRGSFFGFLGPNGAGKSTTIRMLTGLIPATSGSIELLGLPMPAKELAIKQRIGLVPGRIPALRPPHGRRIPGIRGPHVQPRRARSPSSARRNCSTFSNSRTSAAS